jgi:dihydrofolate reductase/thymidylate synthase
MNRNQTQKVSLILACTFDGGIGYDSSIPWHIPEELKKFKKITTTCQDPNKLNAVIMGRKTWESIPRHSRPLLNRLNIILTTDYNYRLNSRNAAENALVAHTINGALAQCRRPYVEHIFVIGGTEIYKMFLRSDKYMGLVDKIYLSVVFWDPYDINKYIPMNNIFEYFDITKDKAYQRESDERLFASYICTPKLTKRRNSY